MPKLPQFLAHVTADIPEEVYAWIQTQAMEQQVTPKQWIFYYLLTAPKRKPIVVPPEHRDRRRVLLEYVAGKL